MAKVIIFQVKNMNMYINLAYLLFCVYLNILFTVVCVFLILEDVYYFFWEIIKSTI
ncbi:hypothetical protein M2372_004508 [Chryseobacterium sp. BIGb0232]|nr:hypothetical protein [Chryseobacterium sp. BIGb0232]ROS08163.1 hypothetical protein EDF65_4612 [Chryseobacterium nakagawai]